MGICRNICLKDPQTEPQAHGSSDPRQEAAHAWLHKIRFCHDHVLREDNCDWSWTTFSPRLLNAGDELCVDVEGFAWQRTLVGLLISTV